MSLDQARVYLNRVLPVPPLGDPNAHFNVHWRVTKDDKMFWSGRACSSVEEMLKAIVWAQGKADISDIYACMSSQRMADQRTAANGFTFKNAVRSQANAVHLRSLFVDVDVKPNAYPDSKTALQATYTFCTEAGLPVPTLCVLSGSGGLHVYWTLDTALTLVEWQPLADALSEATRRHALMTDTACTVDGARILRIPGTTNHKTTPPAKVQIIPLSIQQSDIPLAQMRAALAPYMQAGGSIVALTPRVSTGLTANDELAGGIEKRQARPVQLETVREACGFINEALDTGGKDYSNPLWHLTTLIAAFAEDGRAQAHAMASGHPGYTEDSTNELFDRKVHDREARNLGWPSCKAVRDGGSKHCLTCPAFTLDKSPLHHAKAATMPFGAGGDLPPGYLRNGNDQIVVMRTLPDGTSKQDLVTKYPLTDAWVQRSPFVLNFSTRLTEGAEKTEISVGLSELNGTEFSKKLGSQGLAVARADTTKLQEFLVAWTQKLQQTKNAVIAAQPFGWSVAKGKLDGFAYGGKVWGKGVSRPASLPDPVIGFQYTPCGEMAPWMTASKMITDQGRPALDLILASSFAAPLVRFTGENGVLLSAYSPESGIGKSTAIMVAQAVWGHPKLGVNSLSDTANSAAQKIATTQSLPLFWDELKSDEATMKFVEFVFQVTQGKNRSRLAADQSQRWTGSWETLILAASNDSILDYAARKTKSTTAGIYRVFEFVVPPAPPSIDIGDASRITADLRENFGQAGLVYAKFLGENFEQVAKFVADTQDKLLEKLAGDPSERFWFAAMAALYAGAHYANMLKLTEINLKSLVQYMITVLGQMRAQRKEMPNDLKSALNLSMIMEQYLDARRARNTLVTDRMATRGKPGQIRVLNDITRLDTLLVQIVKDEGILRLKSSEFRQWLVDFKYAPNVVTEAMTAQWGMVRKNGEILGSGTALSNSFKTIIYEIDMHGAQLRGVLDDYGAAPAEEASVGQQ